MIKELKERYDSMSIDQIENTAIASKDISESERRSFIEALYYVRHTKRWKENKNYTTSSFDKYLRGRFMMTESKFDKERIAYISFPEASEKFGPGLVDRVIRKVGSLKAGKILNTLPKNTNIEKIEKAMVSAMPEKKEITFSGPTKPQLKDEIIKLKEKIREKDKQIAEQSEQIIRLKATVERYHVIYGYVRQEPACGCDIRVDF